MRRAGVLRATPKLMFRKICVSTIAIFALMHALSACCNCDDDIRRTRRLEWADGLLKTAAYTQDSSGTHILSSGDSVFSSASLALIHQLDGRVIAMNERFRRSDWFGTAANACKCDEPRYEATTTAKAFVITTLYDFDAGHQAGTPVTDYFKLADYRNGRPVFLPIAVPDLSLLYLSAVETRMYLDTRPANPGPQRFVVALEMSDGAVFRDTTAMLRF